MTPREIRNARLKIEKQHQTLDRELGKLQKKCKHPNAEEGFDDQRYKRCLDCKKLW